MDLHVTTRLPLLPLTCIVIILCLHSVTGQLKWADPIPPFISLPENTPVGTIVASNNLTGGDGLVVVSDNSNAKVNVTSREQHSVLFDVILNNALDYDYGPHVVQCTISGTNAAKDQHISLQIQILVTNINDVTPELKNQPYSVTVPENTGQNTVVYTHIVATDPDMNDVVNYSLSTTGEDVFDITDNGSLVLRGALDFETVRFYHYIVTAKDKVGHNVSADVFITVEDVQDTPPYFTGEPFHAKISEDQKLGDTFLTIRAADGDRGVSNNITLNIISDTCKGLFKINPTSGELQLKSTADRDAGEVNNNNGICTLEVQATEDKQHPQVGGNDTATTSVTVTISDIDDNGPKFAQASYSVTVDENTQQGVPINLNTPITISDADQGTNAEFEVHVISLQDYFEVTPSRIQSSGDILIRVKNSTILDYEVTDLLTLELEAREASLQGNSSNATVMIHINNVNDNSPVFSNSTFYAIVPENSPQKKYVTTVTATDADKPDGNNYGTVLYSLQGSDSSFKINSSSGEVTVNSGSLDREKQNVYYLTVVAEDGGHIKTNALLEITVSDENDERPLFVTNDYQTSLKEGAMTFIPPVTVHATDQDDPNSPNSEIFYIINSTLPQGLENYFSLESDSGKLSVLKPLEFETVNFLPGEVGNITLIIEAKDKGSPALSSTVSVAVNLQDINNKDPVCHQLQNKSDIYENSTKTSPVCQVNATDADGTAPNNVFMFSIDQESAGKFMINSSTGLLSLRDTLDREGQSHYDITVTVTDFGVPARSGTCQVFVDVLDINDTPPKFVQKSKSVQVDENTLGLSVNMSAVDEDVKNKLVYKIIWAQSTALDPEGRNVNISILKNWTAIENDTGKVFNKEKMDRETIEHFTLAVQVEDIYSQTGPQVDTATVTVQVLDKNDKQPTFSQTLYKGQIQENMPDGSEVHLFDLLSVTDEDMDVNSEFKLDVMSPGNVFSVNPASGKGKSQFSLIVQNTSVLDFEQRQDLIFEIVAIETKTANRFSNTATVSISINNTNDNMPEFTNAPFSANVSENVKIGATVTTVQANDADKDPYGIVTYTLLNNQQEFTINETTGEVLTKVMLDRELKEIYTLSVRAADIGHFATTTQLTITVTDLNDQHPQFLLSQISATIAENEQYFSRPLLVEATDADAPGRNSQIKYSLQSVSQNLAANFTINSDNSEITLASPLDYEKLDPKLNGTIYLTVKAEDQGAQTLSNTTTVTIIVKDMNDISPRFTMPNSVASVRENLSIGTSFFNVTAEDLDISPNNHVLSFLIDTLSGSIFNISANSGEITLKTKLDYESVKGYNITVTAMDNGSPVRTSTAVIYVKVTDVNDQNPQFKQKQMVLSTDENKGVHYSCNAFDVDSRNKLVYKIQWNESSGQDALGKPVDAKELQNWFGIDSNSGTVNTLKLLDREQVSKFVLQILVEDTGAEDNKPQTDTATLTITVTDVNDQPPRFSLHFYNTSIRENMPYGSDIEFQNSETLEVSDTDDKESNNHFDVYLLTHNTTFSINPSSGNSKQTFTISVLNSSVLDYEKRKSFTLEVLAIDPNIPSMNSSATILVNIINENDNIPEFLGGPYQVSVPENSTVFKNVIFVNATDEDDGSYGEVTYSLEDTSHQFGIKNTSGEVYLLTGGLDRENVSEYTVKLVATDKGGFRATTQLTIEVSDINDESPVFTEDNYTLIIDENIKTILPEFFVQATDNDDPKTKNSQIKYSLLDNTLPPQSEFSINPDSGKLTLNSPLDYESLNGPFTVLVQAEDQGARPNSVNVSVEVIVNDLNDNPPVFHKNTYTRSIYENAKTDFPVLTVSATDNDLSSSNNNVSYSLDTLSVKTFSIGQNGAISVKDKLDREQTPSYTIIVTAKDNGQPVLTSTAALIVTVLDVNDSPPTFAWDSLSVTRKENTKDVIAKNSATDPDEDYKLYYSILWSESTGMDGDGRFMSGDSLKALVVINNTTGEVYPVNELDREKLQRFQLTLVVEDKKNVPNTKNNDTAILTVIIEDEDDSSPTFNGQDLTATVQENMPPGSEIRMNNVSALIITDADLGDNSMYNITLDDSSVFSISPAHGDGSTTCTITVANKTLLDYEQYQNFTIKVIATELKTSKNESAVITVFILNINDNFPKFNQSSYEANILENAPVGSTITTLQASDADIGDFGLVQYFVDGAQTRFHIDNSTGHVILNTTELDRETQDTYTITVKAKDPGGFEGSTQLTIRVTDYNDQTPKFEAPSYSAEVKENDKVFKVPLFVKATDDDETGTNNSKISYSFTNVPPEFTSNQLYIDASTGEITLLSDAPDYENLTSVNHQDRVLQLEVTATDWGNPPLNASAFVNITVTDINDVKPKFGRSSYSSSVLENATAGEAILTVTATDDDGTSPNNEAYYVILSGSRDKLEINGTSGLISVGIGAKLDRETTERYGFNLTVLAIDKGSPPLTGTTTVSVRVEDVNDSPPNISPVTGVFTVFENASIGDEIIKFSATDEDENNNLKFTIMFSGCHAYDEKDKETNATLIEQWLLIDAVHGIVTVKSTMDREQVEQMVLKVVVADTNAITQYQETTATVTVSLWDVNDNLPVISSGAGVLYLNVSEGTKVDTEVNTLSATDADKRQNVIFSLANTDSFDITNSGTLKLTKGLDRENKTQLSFIVIATDSGSPSLSSNITVTVNVLDINDNDPVFNDSLTEFYVPEHSNNKTLVATVTASDRDAGDNGNVTFDFKDSSPFRINPITGQIYVSEDLDREATPSYTLTVIAKDNPLLESSRRTSMAINIYLQDINDNDPVFHSSNYEGIVSETASIGSPVTITPSISATDKDFGNNSTITFSFADSGSDFFNINSLTGEVFVNETLRDKSGQYSYIVNASDHGNPVRWAQVNLTITILDENIHEPVFVNLSTTLQIPECAVGGRTVYIFSATDADKDKKTNGKVQYYLDTSADIGNNVSQYFVLDADSGLLETKGTASSGTLFDKEKLSEIVIRVFAKDNGIPQHSVQSDPIHIKITDINDNPPEFRPDTKTNFTALEERSHVRIGNVMAFDKDESSQLQYELTDGDAPWKDYFYITTDPLDGGVIYVNKPLDREKVSQIKLKVRANDLSTVVDHDMCDKQANYADIHSVPLDITVFVDDVNDNPPIFSEKSLSVGFLSTTTFGERIINLQSHVTDNDTAPNSVHGFYQVGTMQPDSDITRTWTHDIKPDPVRIDLNGTVSTNYKFSADAYGFFRLQVLVNDSAGNDTLNLKIYVVGESQVVHITLFYTEDELRIFQRDLTKELSKTGYQFVPDNVLPAYADDGSIDNSKSVLVTHAVDSEGNIVSGKTIISTLDSNPNAAEVRNKFKLYKTESGEEVGKQAADTSGERIKYILIGIIAVVVITFIITLALLIHTIQRFKRKLTAATLEVDAITPTKPDIFPGLDNENIKSANPMFMRDDLIIQESKFVDERDHYNRDHSDTMSNTSENSLDRNAISSEKTRTAVDEQEVTLDVYENEETEPGFPSLYSSLHFRHSDTLQHDRSSPYNEITQEPSDVGNDEDINEVVKMNISTSNFDSTDI